MGRVELTTGEIATLLDGLDQLLQTGDAGKDPWYVRHTHEIRKKLVKAVPPEDVDMIDFGSEPVTPDTEAVQEDDDVYTIEDFKDCVDTGFFTDDDGRGVYADSRDEKTRDPVDLRRLDMARKFVVWYNK